MHWIDNKLKPPMDPQPYARDLGVLLPLIALGLVLLPLAQVDQESLFHDVIAQMTSYWLLPAMAFLLALRCGVIDLSVWMSFALGSLVAAAVLQQQGANGPAGFVAPAMAMAAAVGCGLAVGAFNAFFVRFSRFPSVVVTAACALGVMLILGWAFTGSLEQVRGDGSVWTRAGIAVGDRAFEGWHVSLGQGPNGQFVDNPLFFTRMLVVGIAYAAVMLAMLVGESRTRRGPETQDRNTHSRRDRLTLWVSLLGGGALSALGGMLYLLEAPHALVPSWPVGDLRVVAAAVLAGGLLLAGAGRTLLACVCLPAALLLTTLWRQWVWDLDYGGFSLQVGVLIVLALVVGPTLTQTLRCWRKNPRSLLGLLAGPAALLGLLLTAASPVLVEFGSLGRSYDAMVITRYAGLAISAIAIATAVVAWRKART